MADTPYAEAKLSDLVIDQDKPLFFDVETVGLYGRIRLAQFYQADWDAVVIVHNPQPLELACMLTKVHFVAHNASYEVSTLQRQMDAKWIPEQVDDTLYLARLRWYAKDGFALDQVYTYCLGFDPYEQQDIDKKVMQKGNWDVPVLSEKQKLYAATDVYYMPDIWEASKEDTEDTSYKLDMIFLNRAFDFQCNGMPVLQDELQAQYAKNLKELDELNVPINVNSWQQVRPYIGESKSDGLALATYTIEGNDKAKSVRRARKLIKQNSFLDKFDTNRIYGLFLPGARSGRATSKEQNLQQLPRELKHVFGYTPEDGMCLTYADYAQLEMRTIAAITGDLKMLGVLRANEDLHDFTAKMLFGESFTKEQRQIAKTCNFNLLYGGGPGMLRSILIMQAKLMISIGEARIYKAKWGNLYNTVSGWQEKGISNYHHGAPGVTPFGRKYKAKLMTDQLNIENQGAGAEVAKLALHYMYEEYMDVFVPQDVKMINFVHDSYIFENPDDEAIYKPLADLVAKSMQEAWFEFLRSANNLRCRDLPMPVEVFVGYNWGRIESDYLYKLELEGNTYAKV